MRVSNVILGTLGAGSLVVLTAIGCGSSTTAGTGNSGTSTSTSGTGASTGTTGSSGTGACAPTAACIATGIKDPDCLGLVDNTGKTTFGLRMSELTVTSPPVLASGTVATVISGSVALATAACNLTGTGDFSWLLQFDTTAGTLKTGGAKPATDPSSGYSFDTGTQGSVSWAPITAPVAPTATGAFAMTTGQDIVVPIYATGTTPILLPLKQALITMGTLSSNNNCIGKYNAAGLSPAASCAPDSTTPLFLTGASLAGYITLADADNVEISDLEESLCVVLAGSTYSDGANPAHCVKANGVITYNGACTKDSDCGASATPGACQASGFCTGMWCSTTNSAAKTGCSDSVELAATFAASSVLINN